jgi:protein-tyrosine phosphatase
MKRILFVCLGNICRSPLAEAIFKHKIREKGLEGEFEAASCGTANYHIGDPPDPRTVRNALTNGVKIHHLGRQLCTEDFSNFDMILVMDKSNFHNSSRLVKEESAQGTGSHHSKIRMLRFYDPQGKDEDVPDPYYGEDKDFQNVFDILDRTIESMIRELVHSS